MKPNPNTVYRLKEPKPLLFKVLYFKTLKGMARARLFIRVYKNRREMLKAVSIAGGTPMKSGRAVTLGWGANKGGWSRADLFFTKRGLDAEVMSHESCHAADWLLATTPKAARFKNSAENRAFWTGQITRAVVENVKRAGMLPNGI